VREVARTAPDSRGHGGGTSRDFVYTARPVGERGVAVGRSGHGERALCLRST
jgi:hypothetical protein